MPVHWSLIVRAALRWSAPPECPQEDLVHARLAATAGTSLASGADADVTVTRDGDGRYVATVAVRESQGEVGLRTLEESSCEVLADAVVTVLALSLEPPAPPATVPAATLVKTPDVPPPAAPVHEPAPPYEPRFAAGLLVSSDHGVLPSTAIGGGLELAWYPLRSLRVEGSLLRWIGQSSAVGGASLGGSFVLTSGTLRSCWSPLGDTITLGPCVGLDLDHVGASGYGASHVAEGDVTYWAPSVGALVRWQPLPRLALIGLADVAFPIARQSFVIDGAGTIYKPTAAAPRAQIAAEVRF